MPYPLRHYLARLPAGLIVLMMLPGAIAPAPLSARTLNNSLRINDLTIVANLNRTGQLDVTETITVSAPGEVQPLPESSSVLIHKIPLNYHDNQGRSFPITLSSPSLTSNGQPLTIDPAISLDLAQFDLPASLAQPTVFVLKYRLAPIIIRGEVADIFKISATGLAWEVPIDRVSFSLASPGITADDVHCTTGTLGSSSGSCTAEFGKGTLIVTTTRTLNAGEGLNVSAAFPRLAFQEYLESPGGTFEAGPFIVGGIGVVAFIGAIVGWVALARRRRRQYTKAE